MEKPKTLVGKLCEVMGAVGHVPKHGHNAFHDYDYATEADIVDHVRDEMAKRGVLMTMEVASLDVVQPVVDGKAKQFVTTAHLIVTFHDADSPEVLSFKWAGTGQDSGEKGLYKALTGGEKYALMKTFLIPTGDDPERDDKTDTKAAPKAQPPTSEARKATPEQLPPSVQPASLLTLNETQQKRLKDLMKQHGVKAAAVKKQIEQSYPIQTAADIRQKDYDDLCAWIIAGGR